MCVLSMLPHINNLFFFLFLLSSSPLSCPCISFSSLSHVCLLSLLFSCLNCHLLISLVLMLLLPSSKFSFKIVSSSLICSSYSPSSLIPYLLPYVFFSSVIHFFSLPSVSSHPSFHRITHLLILALPFSFTPLLFPQKISSPTCSSSLFLTLTFHMCRQVLSWISQKYGIACHFRM